ESIHARLAERGDLFRPVLEEPQDLGPAMEGIGLSAESDDEEGGEDRRLSVTADVDLAEYERKRDFEGTPEPPPAPVPGDGSVFVIQKHNATRLHYDLRLEKDGVLASWAVPRGLPTAPGDRRLAVRTENHPMEYADFEGWIPKGHYGAGEVRIFDRGAYELIEWKDEKVSFRLHGVRNRGEYHLIKTKENWLVFLSKNSEADQPEPPPVLTPMMAELWAKPFDDSRWRFEPKLDGVRTLAYVTTDSTRLVSRRGRDQTAQYPELDDLAKYVNALWAVLDGEIVAPDEGGRPSFERLQQRIGLTSPREIERARKQLPVLLYVFDVLWIDGEDLTGLPIEERRRRLEGIVTEDGPVRLTYIVDGAGTALFERAKELGFEGVVGKRLGSSYQPGRRSKHWRKVKVTNRIDCVILGWTPGTGARSRTFGALVLGVYDGDDLVFIGQVGTGFTDQRLGELFRALKKIERKTPPTKDPSIKEVKEARWVRPELVCEVEYRELTQAGRRLRAPSFKGLRPDKEPKDCVLP
ncbi:MAG: non-homologous end-joining DNA ligase, partial [Actinomycetota bacterium]